MDITGLTHLTFELEEEDTETSCFRVQSKPQIPLVETPHLERNRVEESFPATSETLLSYRIRFSGEAPQRQAGPP